MPGTQLWDSESGVWWGLNTSSFPSDAGVHPARDLLSVSMVYYVEVFSDASVAEEW